MQLKHIHKKDYHNNQINILLKQEVDNMDRIYFGHGDHLRIHISQEQLHKIGIMKYKIMIIRLQKV